MRSKTKTPRTKLRRIRIPEPPLCGDGRQITETARRAAARGGNVSELQSNRGRNNRESGTRIFTFLREYRGGGVSQRRASRRASSWKRSSSAESLKDDPRLLRFRAVGPMLTENCQRMVVELADHWGDRSMRCFDGSMNYGKPSGVRTGALGVNHEVEIWSRLRGAQSDSLRLWLEN